MENDSLPQYMQIALSIAGRIAGGDVPEGAKISGEAYIALLTLVLALAAAFFRRWLRTKGAERFENL